MVLGIGLGPAFHVIAPGYDLLAAGIVAGLAAYAWHRLSRERRAI
jgi:hypothetical protein